MASFENRLFWSIFGFLALVWIFLLIVLPWEGPGPVLLVAMSFALGAVWKVLGDASRRRPVQKPITPLSPEELKGVRRWGRFDLFGFVGVFVLLGLALWFAAIARIPYFPWVWLTVALVAAAEIVVVHFSGRCPRCEHRLGFDSGLGFASYCGRCGVRLRQGRLPRT